MFDIPANCVFTLFEKWDLLNKYDTIMEKILGNDRVHEKRPSYLFCRNKDFRISWKENNHWK